MSTQTCATSARAMLALILLTHAPLGTADTVWTNLTGNQRWNILVNWSAGVPDAADLARLPVLAAAAPTVILDAGMQARALAIESDYLLFAGSLQLATGNIDVVGANTRATLASTLRGATGLTKLGAGTLVLAGAASYTGATRVANGTLELRSVGERLPDASALVVDEGARLRLAGSSFTETVGTLLGTGTVLFEGDEHTLSVGADNGHDEFHGNLTDTGSGARLVKVGSGTQILRGSNVLGRGVDVRAGELGLTGSETRAGTVTVGGGAALDIKDSSLTVQDDFTLAVGGRLTLRSGAIVTLRHALGASEAGRLDVTGGTLDFVAGRITDGQALVTDTAAALIGARLRIGFGGQMRLSSDFANLGGELLIEGGTLDATGSAGARGHRIESAGQMTLAGGDLILSGGYGGLPRDTPRPRRGGDGGSLLLSGDLLVSAGRLRLTGGDGSNGWIDGGQMLSAGNGGDGGRLTISNEAHARFSGSSVDLRGGRGGTGAGDRGTVASVQSAGHGGNGGQVMVENGTLEILDGSTLQLDGRTQRTFVGGDQLNAGNGGHGGRFEIAGGVARVEHVPGNPVSRISIAGGDRDWLGGRGGDGGELLARGGQLLFRMQTELDMRGGDGATPFGGLAPTDDPNFALGDDGGAGGQITIAGGDVRAQQARFDLRGGRGTHGGDGGAAGRLLLEAGALNLNGGEVDLRGGEALGSGLVEAGRVGAAGSLEQRGGTLVLKGTRLLLSGMDISGPADGGDGGSVLLLGGDASIIGNTTDADVAADGGAASDQTPTHAAGGRGGRGGRLVLDGAGTREIDGSALLSFDGGAGGVGVQTGGAGGDGGELVVRDSTFSVLANAFLGFSGGRGGRSQERSPETGRPRFGDGGAGGSFIISGGKVVIGVPLDAPASRRSQVRLAFDGGDAGNAALEFRDGQDRESRAGRGGELRVLGGTLDVNGGAVLTLRGGRGGRLEGDKSTFAQGGSGGALVVEGGTMALRTGAIVDLGGGDAVTTVRNELVRGGRGGELVLRGDSSRFELDGGALALAGGRATGSQSRTPPRGTAGRVRVEGGALALARGLVTGVESSTELGGVESTWQEHEDLRVRGAELDIEGGVVDALSTLRLDDARVNLGGGTLRARHIVLSGTSAFDFTGGTLDLGRFEGDLRNGGGVLEIGGDAGYTRVLGDFSQAKEGLLVLDLLGPEASEALVVDHGRAELGGRLEIRLADDVLPLAGSDFDILVADEGVFGAFYAFTLPERAGLRFNLVTRPDRLVLEVRAVPLPSAVLLLGPAIAVLGCRRRRVRRAPTVQHVAALH